jgi:hypothetical protein
MARFKDFGSGASSGITEPIVFKLHGEEFTCIPEIQGKVLLDLISDSASDDVVKSTAVTLHFFRSVLTAESLERFNSLIESKTTVVSLETLGDISAWLVEEYTNRPSERSEDSSTGE